MKSLFIKIRNNRKNVWYSVVFIFLLLFYTVFIGFQSFLNISTSYKPNRNQQHYQQQQKRPYILFVGNYYKTLQKLYKRRSSTHIFKKIVLFLFSKSFL